MLSSFLKIDVYFLWFCLVISTLIPLSIQQTSNSTVVVPDTDIGPCTCDLTANACDVSCCCDTDCSATDRLVFTTCIDVYNFSNSQSCFPTTLFFRNNTPYKVNTSSSNLFCIYNDNYQTRNFFTVPDLVPSASEAQRILVAYSSYSYPSATYGFSYTDVASFTDYYKVKDPILIYFESSKFIGRLTMPFSQGSSDCGFDNPVQFLVDRSSSCSRTVTNLNATCSTTKIYNAGNFVNDIKVAFNPVIFKAIIVETVNSTDNMTSVTSYNYTDAQLLPIKMSASCVDANNNAVACDTNSTTPEFIADTATCNKVLKSLTYNFRFSGISGIKSVEAVAVLTSLPVAATSLQQSFAVKFLQDGVTAGVARSGNPGYLLGKPVMAGRLNTTTQAIIVGNDPNQWLTVPSAGDCRNPSRSPVQFGVSTSSGCMLTIEKTITNFCDQYKQTIMNALRGQSPSNRIATFGNSSPSKSGDWLPIYGQDRDVTPTYGAGICNQMVTGAKLTIIYARVGALVNPQNKIIGASMTYVTGSIAYSCSGFNCQPGATAATQTVPISIDVTFVDASTTAVPEEKAKPVFLARLPYDFFYPFYVENGASAVGLSATTLSVSCSLLALWIRAGSGSL